MVFKSFSNKVTVHFKLHYVIKHASLDSLYCFIKPGTCYVVSIVRIQVPEPGQGQFDGKLPVLNVIFVGIPQIPS